MKKSNNYKLLKVSPKLHQYIKLESFKKGISMQEYAKTIIEKKIMKKEKK